ncbi:MAG TPA: ATP-dependent sacrificial sulfur transferase LarE [Vicinamibacterales bacterium]|nr:ATP-dependent sacrificial sulfur transferase LarE [Vicinamibacterales bacterium]
MTTSTTSTTTPTRRRTSTSEHGGSGASDKDQRLRELLSGFSSAIVAFSGGVDSAYLSVVATQVLGSGALCVTADSPSYPEHHRSLARRVAEAFALRHEVVNTAELDRPEYRANPVNRCYYCKQELYTTLTALASARAIDVVLDGNNADDRGDYRPGRQAAREHNVRSPLDEVGLTKAEIRELSRAAGMATWNEPASACLSSRIPYDHEITSEKLRMVEQAEDALRALGFRVCRVRHHDTLARLELGRDEIARALDEGVRDDILRALRAVGYRQVAVDLQGYRMGSLNEGITLQPV